MDSYKNISTEQINIVTGKPHSLSYIYNNYVINQELYGTIKDLSYENKGSHILVSIQKQDECFWDYLFKNKSFNKLHVKIDWNNWCDEEEMNDNINSNSGPGSNFDSNSDPGSNFDMEQLSQMMKQYQQSDITKNELDNDDKDKDKDKDNDKDKDIDDLKDKYRTDICHECVLNEDDIKMPSLTS
jgi:hypothetical protein